MSIESRPPVVPEIVHIVLQQLIKLRAEGDLSPAKLQLQIQRLAREELQPRQLSLLVRELSNGRLRFLIKAADGTVCDLIDGPAVPGESASPFPPQSSFAEPELSIASL